MLNETHLENYGNTTGKPLAILPKQDRLSSIGKDIGIGSKG